MLTRMKNNNNRKTSSFDRSVRNCLSSQFVRSMNHTCHCCANNKQTMAYGYKLTCNHHGEAWKIFSNINPLHQLLRRHRLPPFLTRDQIYEALEIDQTTIERLRSIVWQLDTRVQVVSSLMGYDCFLCLMLMGLSLGSLYFM